MNSDTPEPKMEKPQTTGIPAEQIRREAGVDPAAPGSEKTIYHVDYGDCANLAQLATGLNVILHVVNLGDAISCAAERDGHMGPNQTFPKGASPHPEFDVVLKALQTVLKPGEQVEVRRPQAEFQQALQEARAKAVGKSTYSVGLGDCERLAEVAASLGIKVHMRGAASGLGDLYSCVAERGEVKGYSGDITRKEYLHPEFVAMLKAIRQLLLPAERVEVHCPEGKLPSEEVVKELQDLEEPNPLQKAHDEDLQDPRNQLPEGRPPVAEGVEDRKLAAETMQEMVEETIAGCVGVIPPVGSLLGLQLQKEMVEDVLGVIREKGVDAGRQRLQDLTDAIRGVANDEAAKAVLAQKGEALGAGTPPDVVYWEMHAFRRGLFTIFQMDALVPSDGPGEPLHTGIRKYVGQGVVPILDPQTKEQRGRLEYDYDIPGTNLVEAFANHKAAQEGGRQRAVAAYHEDQRKQRVASQMPGKKRGGGGHRT